LLPEERHVFAEVNEISHVPILGVVNLFGQTDDLLQFAEGKSDLYDSAEREGLVFKNTDGEASFKVISNKFLLETYK